jgi:hypothetical protein
LISHPAPADQLYDAVRRAGKVAGLFQEHPAHVDRRKAIHVLFRGYGGYHRLFIDMLRQGELDENAVDPGILVVRPDQRQQFLLAGFGGKMTTETGHACLGQRLFLAGDVRNRSRVFADENNPQSGPHSPGDKGGHLFLDLRPDFLGDFLSVDDLC